MDALNGWCLQQKRKVAAGLKFPGLFAKVKQTKAFVANELELLAFEVKQAAFAQSNNRCVPVNGKEFVNSLLARFTTVSCRVGVNIVRVNLKRNQPQCLKAKRLTGMSLVVINVGEAIFAPALHPRKGVPSMAFL